MRHFPSAIALALASASAAAGVAGGVDLGGGNDAASIVTSSMSPLIPEAARVVLAAVRSSGDAAAVAAREALLRRRRAQALGDGLRDMFGDGGFDICSLLEMFGGLGGDSSTADFDLECSTNGDGTTTMKFTMGEGEEGGLDQPGFGSVIDIEMVIVIPPLDDMGTPGGAMSSNVCFTHGDDVVEVPLRGKRFCLDLLGGMGDLVSGCDATLGGNDCKCGVCSGGLGIEMACPGFSGVSGEKFNMRCTDLPGAAQGGNVGGLDGIEPRSTLMIPQLITSGNLECQGSRVWCQTVGRCIAPQKTCPSEATMKRRRRRHRRRGLFKNKKAENKAARKKKTEGRKKKAGMFQGGVDGTRARRLRGR